MLENPLIRLFGSSVALASLPAIEIFGSIEQRPTPTIFMIVFVARVDEILGHDVSRHFQSGEITVKLASHSLASEAAGSPKRTSAVNSSSFCMACHYSFTLFFVNFLPFLMFFQMIGLYQYALKTKTLASFGIL